MESLSRFRDVWRKPCPTAASIAAPNAVDSLSLGTATFLRRIFASICIHVTLDVAAPATLTIPVFCPVSCSVISKIDRNVKQTLSKTH